MFIKSMSVVDLGPGAGYALWAFRAAAIGHLECCALVRGYEDVFGADAGGALNAIHEFVRVLGREGGRIIRLSHPGCCHVTADELSVVAALSAAQTAHFSRRDAHLAWLMCGKAEAAARDAADRIATIFGAAEMNIDAPPLEITPPKSPRRLIVHRTAGHA